MLLLAAALTPACDQNAVQDISAPPPGGAQIKFINFAVGSPGVNFYANDRKMTAVSATTCSILTDANREACTGVGAESTSGVGYNNAGAGWYYTDIAPGQYAIQGRIAATTDKGLAIASLQTDLAVGKRYTFYLSGIYSTTAKTAESFIIEDPIPPIDYTVVYVRFVHAISNANPMTLYATDATTLQDKAVGAEVAYKGATAFVALPPGTYNLGARYAGSATNTLSSSNLTFSEGRVYTITAYGNILTTSKGLDRTANW